MKLQVCQKFRYCENGRYRQLSSISFPSTGGRRGRAEIARTGYPRRRRPTRLMHSRIWRVEYNISFFMCSPSARIMATARSSLLASKPSEGMCRTKASACHRDAGAGGGITYATSCPKGSTRRERATPSFRPPDPVGELIER